MKLSILGATGLVGQTLLSLLEATHLSPDQLFLLASNRSAGKTLLFKGQAIEVLDVAEFDFSQSDLAIFSAGAAAAKQYAPIATRQGCTVIDNSSAFRYEEGIPLIVPEVNGHLIQSNLKGKLISNPNCSTIQMLVALNPLYDAVGIKQINVATYQAVSGQGKAAMDELLTQTQEVLSQQTVESNAFPMQMAFNCLPEIDKPEANGYTREEMKMVWETQKIFADSSLQVNPTAVRVPVINGHGLALHIETKQPLKAKEAAQLLEAAPGVELMPYDQAHRIPTQVLTADGQDKVWVGRLRQQLNNDHGLNLWVVADNLRKGAALNAWQIAERLIKVWG